MTGFLTNRRLVLVSLGILVAMGELDRLVGETLAANGQTFTISEVSGPLSLAHTAAWDGWASAATPPSLLILVHLGLDALFILSYCRLLRRWAPAGAPHWGAVVFGLVAVDIVEDLLILVQAGLLFEHSHLGWLATTQAFVTSVKFLVMAAIVILAVGSVLRTRDSRGNLWWRWAVDVYNTVAVHRAAAAVVVAVAVVSVVPRAGVLEQLPDIQRSWIRWTVSGDVYLDWPVLTAALLAVALWGALFILGRVRSSAFSDLFLKQRPDPGVKIYLLWSVPFLAGAFALGLLALLGGIQHDPLLYIDVFVASFYFAITFAIPLVSFLLAKIRRRHDAKALGGPAPDPGAFKARSLTAVQSVGDGIAALSISVLGLGMVRSFTAPSLLGLPAFDTGAPPQLVPIAIIAFALVGAGFALVFFGDLIAGGLRGAFFRLLRLRRSRSGARLANALNPAVPAGRKWGVGTRAVTSGTAILALVTIAVVPLRLTSAIDALATTLLILVSWAVLLTNVETGLQESRPIDLFRSVGFRSAPLLTLFLVIPFLVAQIGQGASVHALQTGATVQIPGNVPNVVDGEEPAKRPTLATALHDWTLRPQCSVDYHGKDPDEVDGQFRPLVLVAAQGGGIRAASWTVYSMREFLKTGVPCTQNSVLLSSGASGGSVGLVMFRGFVSSSGDIDPALLGDQDALSVGLAGTMVTDVLASITGLHVPSQPGYTSSGAWEWQDRAALIQAAWAEKMPQYAARYDFANQAPTGMLILNSTAAGSGCRALVSQVDLDVGISLADDGGDTLSADCAEASPGVSAVIDIQNYCDLDMDWATAAMLSSRFPIVTPSARIGTTDTGRCHALAEQQFVDGGYAENTGLGTLSDIAPELGALIARENSKRGSTPPIVPFVLFLRNEAGADVAAPLLTSSSELLVPLRALSAAEALVSENAWLQRLSDSLDADNVCPRPDTRCFSAVKAARNAVQGGVAVSAPATRPTVVAPLGWTLSDISQQLMRHEAGLQASPSCEHPGPGYAKFGDLLNLIAPDADACRETK